MTFEEALIATVRAERSASSLTVSGLADASGIPLRSLERYLAGTRHINVAVIYQLAEAFGMRGSQLMAEAERRLARSGSAGVQPTPAAEPVTAPQAMAAVADAARKKVAVEDAEQARRNPNAKRKLR